MGKHVQEINLKTINGQSLLGVGDIKVESNAVSSDKLLEVRLVDYSFGAIEETKSSKSLKVCSANTQEAPFLEAKISKGKIKLNEFLNLPLMVSSKPVNAIKRENGRSVNPIKVIHTIEMSVIDSFFVNSSGRRMSDTLILFKKEYDGIKLTEYSQVDTYQSNVCLLTGGIVKGTFGEHNQISLTSNYIKDDNSVSLISYHQVGVAGDPIDSSRYYKKKTEDCEFSIDCYIEYVFADKDDLNSKNIIWDSLIYPNAYIMKRI